MKRPKILPTLFLATLTANSAAPSAIAAQGAPPAFAVCSACHATAATGPSRLGPNLRGVGNRKAGNLAGFRYSAAMKSYGKTWTKETLSAFVAEPRKAVPGTSMPYAGMSNRNTRDEVVDYMLSLK